jgi:hypothetical protein
MQSKEEYRDKGQKRLSYHYLLRPSVVARPSFFQHARTNLFGIAGVRDTRMGRDIGLVRV